MMLPCWKLNWKICFRLFVRGTGQILCPVDLRAVVVVESRILGDGRVSAYI